MSSISIILLTSPILYSNHVPHSRMGLLMSKPVLFPLRWSKTAADALIHSWHTEDSRFSTSAALLLKKRLGFLLNSCWNVRCFLCVTDRLSALPVKWQKIMDYVCGELLISCNLQFRSSNMGSNQKTQRRFSSWTLCLSTSPGTVKWISMLQSFIMTEKLTTIKISSQSKWHIFTLKLPWLLWRWSKILTGWNSVQSWRLKRSCTPRPVIGLLQLDLHCTAGASILH